MVRIGPEHAWRGDSAGNRRIRDLDERAFEDLEDAVDRLGAQANVLEAESVPRPTLAEGSSIRTDAEFQQAIRATIDELPEQIQQALEEVVITLSDDGHREHAYGMHVPGVGPNEGYRWWFFGMGRSALPKRIVIYRDTLLQDFGSDPQLLRAKISQTVRHEVGHALGFDEAGVRRLGL